MRYSRGKPDYRPFGNSRHEGPDQQAKNFRDFGSVLFSERFHLALKLLHRTAMKLTLRDLVWLMLLAAAIVALARERHRLAEELRRQRIVVASDMRTVRPPQPSSAAVSRQATLAGLHLLSDELLQKRLAELTPVWLSGSGVDDYELCLTEMVRRGMAGPLQSHFDELQASKVDAIERHDLQALIAARRAQKLPDPLQIRVSIPAEQVARNEPAPTIHATIANVDVRRAAPNLQRMGNYRGGRLERWRVVLTDARGRQVRDSNSVSFGRTGGLFSYGPLEYGETAECPYDVDLRCYVGPPRSGKYELQLFYHNDRLIADDADLTGLIACQSQPLWIEVTNPNDPRGLEWPAGLSTFLALAGACGLLLVATAWWRSRLSWRDGVWCGMILIAAAAYYADSQYHATALAELSPDVKAEWSIAPCDPPG